MSHPLDAARGLVTGVPLGILMWVLILMPLMGCSPTTLRAVGLLSENATAATAETPVVQARGGSSASLALTTCMITMGGGGQTLTDIVQMLTNGGVLVAAEGGGSARLSINNCPHPPDPAVIREVAQTLRTTRRP